MAAFVETMAVATTRFAQAIRYENAVSSQLETAGEGPRMNWAVVTGTDGERQLRILWRAAGRSIASDGINHG
ncbi:MAG TPA: hypothetical protein VJX69_13575 [Terriglobales bacterium]|nr:hypothetical protein [Terriglobales bacterium]